jgi:hypothetical protein
MLTLILICGDGGAMNFFYLFLLKHFNSNIYLIHFSVKSFNIGFKFWIKTVNCSGILLDFKKF